MVVVVAAIPSSIDNMEDRDRDPNGNSREHSRPASSAFLGAGPGAGHLAVLELELEPESNLLLVSRQGVLDSRYIPSQQSTFPILDVDLALHCFPWATRDLIDWDNHLLIHLIIIFFILQVCIYINISIIYICI